jgi:carboxyl-terminal processing protease
VTNLRGPKGEKVELEVVRESEPNPIKITIVRDNIVVKSVDWKMKEGIAYIGISQFGTELVSEFQAALPNILLEKPKGIIIDLRNNGGGLLDACLKIGNEFFDAKTLVQTKGNAFSTPEKIESLSGGAFINVPLIVLVNKGSASASEIFAGAVQDHGRGILLGEQTFGKGSVQNVIPLSDGSSLKVTVAEWQTPGGKSIHEKGITPDEEVLRTPEDFDNDLDPVLDRAMSIFEKGELEAVLAQTQEKRALEKDSTTEEAVVPVEINSVESATTPTEEATESTEEELE